MGLLAAVLASLLIVSGCASSTVPEVASGDPVLVAGRDIYSRNCSACHGASGGGGRGKRINDGVLPAAYPDIADQIEVVTKGRRSMPAFIGRLSETEIEAVVLYTREILSEVR
jgi:mono/diheme cytochrome c family protein